MSHKSFQSALARNGSTPYTFDIDGEEFMCSPVMPGGAILGLAGMAESQSNAQRAKAVMAVLDAVLLPDSAARFAARMAGGDAPITVEDAAAVVKWLMAEVYASDRPTAGASPSQPGS